MTSPHTVLTRLLSLAAAGAVVLALAGCGDDEGAATDDPTADETSSEATTDEASASATPSENAHSGHGAMRRTKNLVLNAPAEGATVSGSFIASGKANSPEANVPWEIRDDTGKVVLNGFSTAKGWMDKLYPWKTTVDVRGLAPGDYLFVAMTDDPSGGAEGHGPEEVSANITVE